MKDKPPTVHDAAELLLKQLMAREKKPAPELLLAEIDDLLRHRPTAAELTTNADQILEWLGRAKAAVGHWDAVKATNFITIESKLSSSMDGYVSEAYRQLIALINEARFSIRLQAAPESIVAGKGMVHDYFDGVRKIVEGGTTDLFFVDPYLDADFVTRYLPFVPDGVSVRLLARHKVKTLLPAVDIFTAQHKMSLLVRSSDEIHDRYLFVDGKQCVQSGASFHQGAKASGTAVISVTDGFEQLHGLYEGYWTSGKVHR